MVPDIHGMRDLMVFYQALGFDRLPITGLPSTTSHAGRMSRGQVPSRHEGLDELRAYLGDCTRCKLAKHRTKIVFGAGNPQADLMFIGEAPGREEDLQGLPFVGDAGRLLTRLIEKMGMRRDDVYIANVIKCRPPMNRDPEDDETDACREFIQGQIEIVRPRVIMTLGRVALQSLLQLPRVSITAARGHFLEFRDIPVMPTFHPAYLLRNPKDKILTWSDAQKVLARLAAMSGGAQP